MLYVVPFINVVSKINIILNDIELGNCVLRLKGVKCLNGTKDSIIYLFTDIENNV